MAHTDPVKHAVRPPAGPPRVLTVLGAVAAAAAAVVFVGRVNGCGSGSFMYLASATGTLP